MLKPFVRFFNWIKDCLYPRGLVCICCGKELSDAERVLEICFDCADKLPFRGERVCPVCGENTTLGRCPRCNGEGEKFKPHFEKIVAPFGYSGAPRKWVLDYKDGGKPWLAENISYFIAEAVAAVNADVITYVPTSKKAKRRRGFDNSEYLAKCVAERTGLPLEHALVRVKQVKDSPNLSREQRAANVKSAFRVSDKLKTVALKGKNVILVDDLITTGATAEECSELLKTLGAKSVTVAVLCRTETKRSE